MDQIFPFISMFAVANSALINMLMASRLLYGMSKQKVLPPFLRKVHPTRRTPWAAIIFTTVIAFGLIIYVSNADADAIAVLGGTTALLLLGVFTIANVAVLALRHDTVDHDHFRAPAGLPVVGAMACAYLVGPWTGRDTAQYKVAGLLLILGVVLWVITWLVNRATRSPYDVTDEDAISSRGPVN